MNILILVKNSFVNGVITNTANVAAGLIKHYNDNVIIGAAPGEGTDDLKKEYDVVELNFDTKRISGIYKTYKLLSSIILAKNIDIIHAQNRIPALYASVYCFLHKNLNYIWANHLVPLSGSYKSRLFTKVGYCAVAEGSEGKEMLINTLHIPKNKIRVINLGVDLSKFVKSSPAEQKALKKRLEIKDEEKVILLYGRLCENKGHLFLLDALSKVKNREFKLIFPGKNDEFKKQVDEKAGKYGLSDDIIYPGFVNGPACLSICDLMVLPSRNEGFPQACVEAYAMGVPVIRTKSGGYEDTKDMCFGVDFGDVDTLAELIQNFFDKPHVYTEKAKVASQKVGRLSIERMAEDYHAIYQEAIDARKK